MASAQGPQVQPEVLLHEAPRLDLLLVPGGNVASARHDRHVLEWLTDRSGDAEIVMAVGSGIELLAATGIMDGRRAVQNTSFFATPPGSSGVDRVGGRDWIIDGRYVTCTGGRAAVDMALGVASRLLGDTAARQLATHV